MARNNNLQHFSKFSRQSSGNSSLSRKRPSHLLTGNARPFYRNNNDASTRLTMNTLVRDLGGDVTLDYSDLEPNSPHINPRGNNPENGSGNRPSRSTTIMNKKLSKISPNDEEDEDDNVNWNALYRQDMSMKPYYIVLPNGKIRSTWDVYLCFLLMYVAAFVPYRVSYMTDLTGAIQVIDACVDCSFGFDILLNFFTAFSRPDGILVWDMKMIAIRYLKGFFLLDLVATFPFDVVINETIDDSSGISGFHQASKLTRLPKLMKILRIMRLLKLLRVYRINQFIRSIELNYNVHQGVSRLFQIWLIIMLVTHLVGCLWHATGTKLDMELDASQCDFDSENFDTNDGGWVCREGLTDSSSGHKYVASLYWAFSTLTTVGYGDISARTVYEQLFSMLMMLLGVSWYAYVVGSMTMIVSSFDRQTKQARTKLIEVNTFIREAKLPVELGSRIRNYFEFSISRKQSAIFAKRTHVGYNADEILLELSSSLRTDVVTYAERDLIEKIPFFKDKSLTFVSNAVQLLQPVFVQDGDFVIKENSVADEMYFLIKGKAAVLYGDKQVATLKNGAYFGEVGCVLGGVRKAGIIAITKCELRCLSKRNLNLLLGEYPMVGEEIKRTARERLKRAQRDGSQETQPPTSGDQRKGTTTPSDATKNIHGHFDSTDNDGDVNGKTITDTDTKRAEGSIEQLERTIDEMSIIPESFRELNDSSSGADERYLGRGSMRKISITSNISLRSSSEIDDKGSNDTNTQKQNIPEQPTAASSSLSRLSTPDRELIEIQIAKKVQKLVETKMEEIFDALMDQNIKIMNRWREQQQQQEEPNETSR